MNEQTQALRDCLDLIGRIADTAADGALPAELDDVYDAGCLCAAGTRAEQTRRPTATTLIRGGSH